MDRPELREKIVILTDKKIQSILDEWRPFTTTPMPMIKEILKVQLALIPDVVAKLKQAVKDARDGKDIDLPEELYEVFCSIQNQAIGKAKKQEQERITSIIKEYKLESASVRDDMLELRAKGWNLLWQALKEEK